MTVLMLTPVMRVTLRRLLPSTSAATICPRFAVLSLFILNIMLDRLAVVNKNPALMEKDWTGDRGCV